MSAEQMEHSLRRAAQELQAAINAGRSVINALETMDLGAARVEATLWLLDELAAFSERIGCQAEITLRPDGGGYVALTNVAAYPLLNTDRCFWAFESIAELTGILRGEG